MRILLLFLVLFISKFGFSQGQPWVGNNAVWQFHYMYPCLDCFGLGYRVWKTGNVMRGSHLCDQLITYEHDNTMNPLDSVVIDTNYTYLSVTGDSVMYEQEGVFRVLYDFSAPVGDSTLYHVSSVQPPVWSGCVDSSYATIISNDIVSIGGVDYRSQQTGGSMYRAYWFGYGAINERFGPMETNFLFPFKNSNCWGSEYEYYFTFLCFSDDDLEYDLGCEYLSVIHSEQNNVNSITISPNPFTYTIQLSELNDDGALVELSDNLGKIIIGNCSTKELETYNAAELKEGVYWLRVTFSNGYTTTKKLIKI